MPVRIGTSYFLSFLSALRYYKPYGFDESDIQGKLAAGEIHIGKPPTGQGQKLVMIDRATRWAIEESGE